MSQKYILKVFATVQKYHTKIFCADEIDVWALKTLKKVKRRFLGAIHSH